MRLAFIYSAAAPVNAQYRALLPMAMLKARGHDIVWYGSSDERMPIELVRRSDLIHVYRAADPNLLGHLSALQRDGVAVSWDNDDDIRALPKESPSYPRLGGLNGQRDFRQQMHAIQLADTVTTTSHTLVDAYASVGADYVEVIENYLPPEFGRGSRVRNGGVSIGWVGLREHEADAKLLSLDSALVDVLETHPETRLVTIGLKLGVQHERYEHRPKVPFEDLAAALRQFDIGLAPLADIPFNRARSNVKLKEYAVAGVPWLASPVGEYAKLGAKQGGRHVSDDSWGDALGELVERRRDRVILGTRGRLWARRQTIELHVHRWQDTFEATIARVQASRGLSDKVQPPLSNSGAST